MHIDNPSAMDFVHTGATDYRNKHIAVRYHSIRQVILERVLTIQYFPTDEIMADMLFKALGCPILKKLIVCVGLNLAESALQLR